MTNTSKNFDQEEFYEHYRIDVDPGQDALRIDKFLLNRLENVSRNKIQNAAKSGCIRVNDHAVKSNYKVKPNDQISVLLPEPPRDKDVKPENIPLNILYEDDNLLIVNKEAGMVVHPAYANFTGTLVNALLYHFGQLPADTNNIFRAGLVHRIDKDTSGLLVIAKDDFSLSHLAKQFYDHSIERKYKALVWGHVEADEGSIRKHVMRDPKDRRRMISVDETDKGKHAVTHFRVLERFSYTTLLSCQLETGRTHQIRSHMASIGHPLFNDETYGGASIRSGPTFSKYKQFVDNCFKLIPRQALHAQTLGFIHPHTREKVFFQSELPADFEAVLQKWRAYSRAVEDF
jgi:23S rRNA pseudouridine1911/1915/1917 synthase